MGIRLKMGILLSGSHHANRTLETTLRTKIWSIYALLLLASCGQNKISSELVRSEQANDFTAPRSEATAPVSETTAAVPALETLIPSPASSPTEHIQGKFGHWSSFPGKDGVPVVFIRGDRIFVLLGTGTKELAKQDKVTVEAEMLRGSFKIEDGKMLISGIQYSCDGVTDQSEAIRSQEDTYSFVKGEKSADDVLTVGSYRVRRNELDLSNADFKLQVGCWTTVKGSPAFIEAQDFLEGAF